MLGSAGNETSTSPGDQVSVTASTQRDVILVLMAASAPDEPRRSVGACGPGQVMRGTGEQLSDWHAGTRTRRPGTGGRPPPARAQAS